MSEKSGETAMEKSNETAISQSSAAESLSTAQSTVSVATAVSSLQPPPPPPAAVAERRPIVPAWLLDSNTESTISASRRICRICQMHEGAMVRPCDCAGTMGDVHEECLTKWVNMSKKKSCEICKSEYAKSGVQFKRFAEWKRPECDVKTCVHVVIIVFLAALVAHVAIVIHERAFYERVFLMDYQCRPDDTGRILLTIVLMFSIVNNVYTLARSGAAYLRSQRQIRFIDKRG